MINDKTINALRKAGVTVILGAGVVAIFWMFMSHTLEQNKLNAEEQRKEDEHQREHDRLLMEYLKRQTIAFEKIVDIYSGPEE